MDKPVIKHILGTVNKDGAEGSIENTGPGTFEIILSTGDLDRDGEKVLIDEWEMPLPDHITMDMDHGMDVASTVGSGIPTIENGNLIVRGSYASTSEGQKVRTLVGEGHIRSTSVAFIRKSNENEKGVISTSRELLNGAFVAIPSNTKAVVLASKDVKTKDAATLLEEALDSLQGIDLTSLGLDQQQALAVLLGSMPADEIEESESAEETAEESAVEDADSEDESIELELENLLIQIESDLL